MGYRYPEKAIQLWVYPLCFLGDRAIPIHHYDKIGAGEKYVKDLKANVIFQFPIDYVILILYTEIGSAVEPGFGIGSDSHINS